MSLKYGSEGRKLGVCCAIPSLFSDEGHEMLAETLKAIKTLVVVVNVWSENLFPSVNVFEVVIIIILQQRRDLRGFNKFIKKPQRSHTHAYILTYTCGNALCRHI